MKRKVLITVVLSLALMAAGCSDKEADTAETGTEAAAETGTETSGETEDGTESETEAAERPDYTALDYVTLGEYKGLTVELATTQVTEDEIDSEITSALSQNDMLETLEEGTVENGDIANIDYEGTMDGDSFDGGSDKGYDLTIGSGTFIDGFEEGLIGQTVGDTVELNLTFPEDYSSTEVAGQDVVFTVTINSVQRAPELTDELVEELTDSEYTTVDDYRASIETTLQEEKESERESELTNDLLTQVYNNATINGYPTELIEYIKQQYVDYYTEYAEESGMTLEEFVDGYLGVTEDEFYTEIEEYAQQSIVQEMLLKAIAETEGLELTADEYQERAQAYVDELGLDSVSTLEETYGATLVETNLLLDKAYELVEDSAIIIDPDETEDESETETEAESGEADESGTTGE